MGQSRNGYALTPSTDDFTGFGVGITGDHAYIHQGKAFSSAGTASVAANAEYSLTLTTPAASSGYVHYRPARVASSASYMEVSLIEAPTFTAGTGGAEINRNRNKANAAATAYAYGATYTSGGTVLDIITIGSGGRPSRIGGGSGGADEEIVLKPSTTYLIRGVNPAGGATSVFSWQLFWYEETMGA